MSEKMLQPIQAELVFNSSKYAMEHAKTFKQQQALVKAYQQGYRDHKDRSDAQLQELINAIVSYEKTRIDFKSLPTIVKGREKMLMDIIEKVRAEYMINI